MKSTVFTIANVICPDLSGAGFKSRDDKLLLKHFHKRKQSWQEEKKH